MGLITQSEQEYYDGDNFGGYQFVSLSRVIKNFLATYTGSGKILDGIDVGDISFHAHRALQELSFDTLKSCKSQEIEVPPSLTMPLPQDYVNYVKLVWSDANGIEHIIYPTSKTSNPKPILQNNGDYSLTAIGTLTAGSDTIVLDGEYSNILVGMIVTAPSIPAGNPLQTGSDFAIVASTSNSGGITTITITDRPPYSTPLTATWGTGASTDSQETLTFTPGFLGSSSAGLTSNNIILQETSSHIVENLYWNTTDNKITASSASDISNIKVDMLVSHEFYPIGTKVVDVNGAIITTSRLPSTAVTSGGEVTFVEEINAHGTKNRISDTWSKYKGSGSNQVAVDQSITTDLAVDADNYFQNIGQRYGIDPQYAQTNGSYFIDCAQGMIHFSSNLSGKTIILKYISDSVGKDGEMLVHKFAEEAIYKWILYGCLIARVNIPEYVIQRFKKEKFAETRKAKLRLSNIKLEEITQILRGKSKQIKH